MSDESDGLPQPTRWPEGWVALDRRTAESMENELIRELHQSHPLYGLGTSALARRVGRDEFLFRVHGPRPMFAQVHLTWTVEEDAEFPWTTLYEKFQQWLDTSDKPAYRRRSRKKFLVTLLLFGIAGYFAFGLARGIIPGKVDLLNPQNLFGVLVGASAAIRWYLAGPVKFQWRRESVSREPKKYTWLGQAQADGWQMTETMPERPDDSTTDR